MLCRRQQEEEKQQVVTSSKWKVYVTVCQGTKAAASQDQSSCLLLPQQLDSWRDLVLKAMSNLASEEKIGIELCSIYLFPHCKHNVQAS